MEKAVWVPYLHTAFPKGTERRKVDSQISAVNQLRNRIAHDEPLFTSTVVPSDTHEDMLACLMLFAPAVHHHIVSTSKVAEVLADKPTVDKGESDGFA